MSEPASPDRTTAERSVEFQERYLVPVILVVALIAVALTWAVGGIPWWLAVPILALGVLAMVQRVQAGRR